MIFAAGTARNADCQVSGARAQPLGITASNVHSDWLSGNPSVQKSRFSSGTGALVGALVGGAAGTLFVLLKGDYHSCATDVGPGYCRLTELGVVAALAIVGALVGYVLGDG